MPEYQSEQGLTGWDGDIPSLIAEMKRRAGVRTDRDLATFLGVAQSTVSHWRARSQVPESAVLRFEQMLKAGGQPAAARAIAARMIALRLGEIWYQQAKSAGAKGGRALFYGPVALAFHSITDAIYQQLLIHEQQTGRGPAELAAQLLNDDAFVAQFIDLAKEIPAS